jgi:TfoX/Sxy family transcriptional regulator of competence genes
VKWRRSPERLVAAFDAALPSEPSAERRAMFGYPCCFVRGNMFAGLHQESLIVRLPERERGELLSVPGAHTFEPMPGRPMREYVVVPESIVADGKALRAWIDRAFEYASTLPAKGARAAGAKKKNPPPAKRKVAGTKPAARSAGRASSGTRAPRK